MSADREKELFLAGFGIESPTDRAAFLDQACAGDAALRQRVDALFEAQRKNRSFLEHPAVERLPTERLADTTDGFEDRAPGSRTTPRVDDISLDFLEASQQPGSLGRLGQYEILEAVGRGGMGVVLKARDTKLHRVVAIKVLAPELASNPTARKRFAREAQAAAAVSHDHVVTIYAVEDGDCPGRSERPGQCDLPYLVMEFIDGQSLQDKIDQGGPLELKEILRIGRQVAAGLAAAHEQGLIHRDVKPSNILLQNGVQRVQITDFGLARAVDDVGMTKSGEVTGTPQFMSPEQAQGHPVDARSDLFSLGSVLYTMCTGRSPFRADTSVASLRRVCDDTPRPIREINSDAPDWLAAIIDRLLEKNPEDRFQTAEEVAELLGRHLAHLQDPGSTPFPGTERPLQRRASSHTGGHRHRWVVAGLVLFVMVASFGVTEATGVTRFTASVISIVRGDGTLIVKVDDPDVSVTIEGDDVVITGAGPREVRLKPGQYQVRATKDGNPVGTELVTITRRGRRVVHVTQVPAGLSADTTETAGDYAAIPPGSITRVRRLAGHTDGVTDLKVFSDGARCLTASHDGTVRTWEIPTSRLLHTFRFGDYHGGMVIALAPDQELGAAGTDGQGTIQLFEVETGTLLQQFSGHSDVINRLEFSPNGRRLLSRSRDETLRLWEVETGKELCRLVFEPWWSRAAAFSHTGDALFYGDGGFTVCWNIETASETWRAGDDAPGLDVTSIVVSPNGHRLATSTYGGPIHLRDAETGELLGTFVGHPAQSHSDIAFTPDGRHLLSGNNVDETLRVWSVETFTEVCRIKADRAIVNKLAVLRDGRDVITAGGIRYQPLDQWIPEGNYDLHVWRLPESVWSRTGQSQTGSATDSEPFVVLRSDGQTAGRFETLADAVLGSSRGDTIEIRGDGPFVIGQIEIRRPLIIRAGDRFRPVLVCDPTAPFGENTSWISHTSPLVLEGLDLDGSTVPRTTSPSNLLTSNAPLAMANCRLVWGNRLGHALLCSAQGTLRNCFLINSVPGYAFSWSDFEPRASGCTFVIENGIHVGLTNHAYFGTSADAFELRDCTLFNTSESALQLQLWKTPQHVEGQPLQNPHRIVVSSCVSDSDGEIVHLAPSGELPGSIDRNRIEELAPRLFPIVDDQNLWGTGGPLLRISSGVDENDDNVIQELSVWNEYWGLADSGSIRGVIRFEGGDLSSKVLSQPDHLTPDDFRLRPDSAGYQAGPDGKDLGADVDLVGPGKAYTRWKQTPEYAEWLEETESLMLEARNASTDAGVLIIEESRLVGRHEGGVDAVAFSPDGRYVLSAGGGEFEDGQFRDGTDFAIRLWDLQGSEVRRFEGHTGHVYCLKFLSDGRRFLSSSQDGSVRLWDVESAEQLGYFQAAGSHVRSVALFPDGHRFATYGGSWLKIFDLDSDIVRPPPFQEHGPGLWSVDVSPDGRFIVSSGVERHGDNGFSGSIALHEIESGTRLWEHRSEDSGFHAVAFLDEGRKVLSVGIKMPAMVWDATTGKTLQILNIWSIDDFAISPDERFLLAIGGNSPHRDVKLHDLRTGQRIARFSGHAVMPSAVAFSPDARLALSGGADGTVRLWELPEVVWVREQASSAAEGTTDVNATESGAREDQPMPD